MRTYDLVNANKDSHKAISIWISLVNLRFLSRNFYRKDSKNVKNILNSINKQLPKDIIFNIKKSSENYIEWQLYFLKNDNVYVLPMVFQDIENPKRRFLSHCKDNVEMIDLMLESKGCRHTIYKNSTVIQKFDFEKEIDSNLSPMYIRSSPLFFDEFLKYTEGN